MAKAFPPNPFTVKYLGRVFAGNGAAWLTHSGSGIEFNVVAKALAVTLVGDETSVAPVQGEEHRARYAVYLDDQLFTDGIMDEKEKRIILFNAQGIRSAKVKIIKLSEAQYSFVGVASIITDGAAFVTPETQKDLRIEFVGASTSCGFGLDAKTLDEPFSTATENILKSYAYITAQNLNADMSVVAYSGFGVVSGYTSDGSKNANQVLPKCYELVAASRSKIASQQKWNFQNFHPSIIVVNLGTNDSFYVENDPSRADDFFCAYKEFIGMLRRLNPNAHIVCTIGMMVEGDRLSGQIEKAVKTFVQETKDRKVSFLTFTPPSENEKKTILNHPSVSTNERCAQTLTYFIKKEVLKIKD